MTTSVPHILIVDDEPMNISILSEYLFDKYYRLTTAVNGEIAWKILQAAPTSFDVILLDRMMPEMNGMELIKRIKAHPELKSCPVVFQTALDDQRDVLEGMRAGAYYYLTKPFQEEQLLSVVDAAIEEHLDYRRLQAMLADNTEKLGELNQASFRFQTVEEAQALASLIAKSCPQPEKAVIGLSELMVNAVEHGNLGITYQEKTRLVNSADHQWKDEIKRRLDLDQYKHKYAEVNFSLNEEKKEIEVVISDQGEGFDWLPYIEVQAERIGDNHGRGIAMARMLSFSRIEYKGTGNEVFAYIDCSERVEESQSGEDFHLEKTS